jgi:hypothetical protein
LCSQDTFWLSSTHLSEFVTVHVYEDLIKACFRVTNCLTGTGGIFWDTRLSVLKLVESWPNLSECLSPVPGTHLDYGGNSGNIC